MTAIAGLTLIIFGLTLIGLSIPESQPQKARDDDYLYPRYSPVQTENHQPSNILRDTGGLLLIIGVLLMFL
ncbi:hypothetical protein [Melghirimyces algeriensis]|uniref:Uncharacterized protein n=1 Tax=Melghirimyces algeriensis TaxID=910412 RepID=A0A521CTP5_9BACL|nr:hypothetical protein [Melghirimyces algeriensis]SMO62857.1 hypothetical protein SAMN06264849_104178 [Melghirimyces algeriensis]